MGYRARHSALYLVAVTLLSAPVDGSAQADPYGRQTYEETVATARRLVPTQPMPAWQVPIRGETADLIEFVGPDRLLVGTIEVDKNAAPEHGPLYLLDAASGEVMWREDRPSLDGGRYSVAAAAPSLLLVGSEEDGARFRALDPDRGRRRWELEVRAPYRYGVSADGRRLVLLEGVGPDARLRAVDTSSGDDMWSLAVGEAIGDAAEPVLWVRAAVAVVVGRSVVEVALDEGRIERTLSAPSLASDSAQVLALGADFVVWGGRSISFLDAASASARWTTEWAEHIDGVAFAGSGLVVSSAAGLAWLGLQDGERHWSHSPREAPTSPIGFERGRVVYATASELVGLEAQGGRVAFRTPLRSELVDGSPTEAEAIGVPDLLRTGGGTVLLARERAGLAAYDPTDGRELWYQGHAGGAGTTRYTADARYAYVIEAQMMAGQIRLDGSGPLPRLGVAGTGGQRLLMAAQRDYEAARSRYDALGSDAGMMERVSAGQQLRWSAEQQITATQLDITMGRMNAGVALASSILSLREVIRARAVAAGREGLVARARLSMEGTLDLQQRLFQSGYYVRPFHLPNRGRGVTLVRPDRGLRRDIVFSPHSAPWDAYGVDIPVFALDPTGQRLVMVGIGLDADRYQRRDRWDTHVPDVSILSYDIGALELAEHPSLPAFLDDAIMAGDAPLAVQMLAGGADPNEPDARTGDTPLHLAVGLMRTDIVRALLEKGADPEALNGRGQTPMELNAVPEIRDLLIAAGAPDPGEDTDAPTDLGFYTDPLFAAVSGGNADAIRNAVAGGSDPNLRLDVGQTILYLAVALDNPETVRLLIELGADVDVQDNAGRSPLDEARSDAVRDALRGR